MATSESEDFESADEEFDEGVSGTDKTSSVSTQANVENQCDKPAVPACDISDKPKDKQASKTVKNSSQEVDNSDKSGIKGKENCIVSSVEDQECENVGDVSTTSSKQTEKSEAISVSKLENVADCEDSDLIQENVAIAKEETSSKMIRRHERQQRKPKESKVGQSGTKKLGTRVAAGTASVAAAVATEREEGPQLDIVCSKEENVNKKLGSRVAARSASVSATVTSDQDELDTETCIKEENVDIIKPPQQQQPGNNYEAAPSKEQFTSVLDKLSNNSQSSNETSSATQSGGWGWGSWGSSLLSSATASVSTLTSHVSQGLSTVIDSVEGGLGAPNPEELARQDLEAEKIIAEIKEPTPEEDIESPDTVGENDGAGLFPLGQLISGVSQLGKMVENTGAKVLSGGLDTLEVIGKKTMAVLQEGDPGLKKKRALFTPDGPILSQALREAKNRAEEEAKLVEEKQAARKVHFETLFDDYQGLIHLEALEMLGRQCEMKLQSSLLGLSGAELVATQERLQAVRDECLLPDPDDVPDEASAELEEKLTGAFAALPVALTAEKLLKVWSNLNSDASEEVDTLAALNERAVAGLAQLTAACVEHFHRAGELLLVHEQRDPTQEATHLMQITLIKSSMIEQLASTYCEALNSFGEPAQPIITKVFLEASNSSTYVQDAFQLLVPVLQIGAV